MDLTLIISKKMLNIMKLIISACLCIVSLRCLVLLDQLSYITTAHIKTYSYQY